MFHWNSRPPYLDLGRTKAALFLMHNLVHNRLRLPVVTVLAHNRISNYHIPAASESISVTNGGNCLTHVSPDSNSFTRSSKSLIRPTKSLVALIFTE